ncbi:MAG: aminoglycoside phosphotransferase family protein [Thermomicrobiales bacterium]|nr:aminoglycoside phosphotransferase family protein [Thermomicrobiales bacterium]
MSDAVPAITLPNGLIIGSETTAQYLWGGRETGLQWLAQLPDLLNAICQQHTITLSSEIPEQSMNLVLFGESATRGPVVLKLAPPHEEIASEFAMTMHVAGHGYPQVFGGDIRAAWLLMERVLPGTTLQELAMNGAIPDDEATEIAADLLLRIDTPLPAEGAFPDLRRWLKSLFEYKDRHGTTGPLPIDQVELALRHAEWLLHLDETPQLLHGDFHHGNIIKGTDGWMPIDPKGVIAPPPFELGPWFYNPLEVDKRPNLQELFAKRMDIFSQRLGIDRVTLWRSVFVACVLSDCWTVEDAHPEYCHHSSITRALLELPEAPG